MKKIKVSKTMMYQLVKKHSVYKLPRMSDVEFSSYQSTYWLRFWDTEEEKSVKAT